MRERQLRVTPGSAALLCTLSPPAMLTEDESAFLFSERVVVHVKPVGRDEFTSPLTVRLRPDSIAHPRSLLVELTDEADLFFYHSLALGEGDFNKLKSEQRLLVDFQSFPAQLVELLHRCMEAAGTQDGSSKMLAFLDCGVGGESIFSIVESTRFRELTHIALGLRQGADDVVKQHLAGELRTLRVESAELAKSLRVTDEALSSSKRHVDELMAREKTFKATHQREIAELRSGHERVMAENQRAATDERGRLEAELRRSLDAASARASKAEREVEELVQQCQTLTATEAKLQQAVQEVLELKTLQRQFVGIYLPPALLHWYGYVRRTGFAALENLSSVSSGREARGPLWRGRLGLTEKAAAASLTVVVLAIGAAVTWAVRHFREQRSR